MVGLISSSRTAKSLIRLYELMYRTRPYSCAEDIVTANYFGQSLESFRIIAVLVALIIKLVIIDE
jgi:hypothetical protein